MKKIIIMMLLVGGLVGASAQDIEGFRDLKFGDSASKLLGQKNEVSNKYDTVSYTLENDKKTIGDAKVNEIMYRFFQDKFFNVSMTFDGYSNFLALKTMLDAKYGAPKQLNKYSKEYYYPYGYGTATLSYSGATLQGFLFITGLVVAEKQKEFERQAIAKKADEL